MTGPNTFQYPSYYPSGEQEWSTFLKRRGELLSDIETRFSLSQFLTQQDPTLALNVGAAQAAADSLANTHQVQGQNQDGSLTKFQWSRTEPTEEEKNQLLGAAKFWNIDNADKIPPKALRNIIEAKRLSAAAEGRGGLNPLADVGLTSLAAIGLGTTQQLVGLAQKIPFIGHAVAENHSVKQASQWLASVNEGVQAGMSEGERSGYQIAHGLGGLLGTSPVFGAAWKAAGAVGGLGAVTSGATGAGVIARGGAAAAQGGLSAWMLSGGGDQSVEEAATNVALGAGLGVAGMALVEGLPRIAQRLRDAFPTTGDIPLDRRPFGQGSRTVDAEWYFEADHQLSNPSPDRPKGWLPESTGPEGPTGGTDPFIADRPNQPGTDLTVRQPMGLMSPERASITERILSLEEHRDVARRAMETDALTGLGNKRALERVRPEVDMDQSLGWAVFDGKKFKLVNDTHGHGVGDQTLINFGRAITQAAQEMNIPARIFRQGGDEFSAVVPKDQLQDFTQRVAQLSYQKVGGVETWLDGYAHDTFGEADLTLMQNKRGGTVSPQTVTPTPDYRTNLEQFAIESGGYVPRTGEFPAQVPGAGDYAATGLVPQGADPFLVDRGTYPHSDLVGNPNRFSSFQATSPDLITQGNKPAETTATGVTIHTPPQALTEPRQIDWSPTNWRERYGDRVDQLGKYQLLEVWQELEANYAAAPKGTFQEELIHRDLLNIRNEVDARGIDRTSWQAAALSKRPSSGVPDYVREEMYRRGLDPARTFNDVELNDPNIRAAINADPTLTEEQKLNVLRTGSAEPLSVAADDAAALSKQATVLNSEYLPEVAASSEINISDVVKAELSKAPQEIHIIQRVGDVGKVMRQLTQAQVDKRLMPHNFRLVERNGGMDLIVSDNKAISNKQVEQYRQYGFFDTQAVYANGSYGVVKNANSGDGLATIHDPYLNQDYEVPHEQIMPTTNSLTTRLEDGPSLYAEFKDYVHDYMTREAAKVPDATIDTSWTSTETSSQLPRLLEAFLDDRFVDQPISKAAYEAYFNIQRVHDFQNLASEELDELKRISEILANERRINPVPYLPIEEIAGTKGFSYVATPGTRGGSLVDRLSDLRVPVENEDAAYEFLRNFQREMPDYSPISDVPPEIMGSDPHAANPGDDLEPIFQDHYAGTRESMDDVGERINREIEAMIEAVERPALTQGPAGSGSGGGAPPPPSGPTLGDGGLDALPPGWRPSLGEQFATALRTRPRELHEIDQSLDGLILQWFTPWRHVAAMVEHELKDIGITEGRLWAQQNKVSVGVTEAHNAALPWHVEWADIMSYFRRPLLRKGIVTKIAEIIDPHEQTLAMKEAGYNNQEIVAQHRIKDFNDRFFRMLADDPAYNIDDSRYLAGYMSHIRMRQGQPGIYDPFAGGDAMLPPHMRFFAEMVREGNMQFRQMDARVLGAKMIRSAFFKKFVDPAYSEMVQAWQDPRIPTKFRELTLDWLQTVRTGHQPGGDMAIKGVRRMFNIMGLPVTDAEVGGLMNVGFGNMYRAQLGGRPDAVFRDSIQIYFTGVRIGFKPVNEVMLDMFRGGKTVVQEIQQRALEGGWLEKGMSRVANADIWEAGLQTPEGVDLLSESAHRRRETLAKMGDLFWSATPKSMRGGLQGTRFDPLLWYTKLGEMLRAVAGEAGYRVANRALTEYGDVIRSVADGNLAPAERAAQMDAAMKDLMKASKARAYHQVVQDEFQRLVENGQMKEAAYLLANKAADHQFRYGAKENPIAVRKAGMTGRAIMQFGSFTNQYVGEMRDMFMAPGVHPVEKVQMGLRYATVAAALGGAAAYTGWRFGRWQWHQSLTFAGGPLGGAIASGAQAATGALANLFDVTPSPAQTDALRQWQHPVSNILGGIEHYVDPYTSTRRTIGNVIDMAGSVNPVEGTARSLITGEASIQPDMRQFLDSLGKTTIWPDHPGVPGSGAY